MPPSEAWTDDYVAELLAQDAKTNLASSGLNGLFDRRYECACWNYMRCTRIQTLGTDRYVQANWFCSQTEQEVLAEHLARH